MRINNKCGYSMAVQLIHAHGRLRVGLQILHLIQYRDQISD